MEPFIDFLKEINIAQIFIIFAGGWFFYSRLDNKIEKLENKISGDLLQINVKIDKLDTRLSEKIEDVDRRLCRIEGSLATQGHCLFNQTSKEKKAE